MGESADLALNFMSRRSLPPRGRWRLGLAAWLGPRPHSPTSVREARPPHLGGSHPKLPPQTPLALKKNKKKESKNRKNESKKTAFALVFLSTLQGFLFLTATTKFRPSSGGATQSVPPFLPRTRWKSGALKASGRDLIGPFTRQQGDWPAPSRRAGRVVLSRDVIPEI